MNADNPHYVNYDETIRALREWRDVAQERSERNDVSAPVRWEEAGKAWAFARAIELLKAGGKNGGRPCPICTHGGQRVRPADHCVHGI